METKKSYIAWTIRIIVSALFILSAVAKLSKGHILDSPYFAISTFEVKQLYPLGFSMNFASFFSRTLIGIELALGLLLLQKNWLRKFVIPATIFLLVIFIGHLTYVTFLSGGNTGNCGCFGELLPMTPIQAIIKNIVAVGLLVYLFTLLPKIETSRNNFWVLTTVLFASILSIFMLAPIQPAQIEYSVSTIEETPTDSLAIDDNTQTITIDSSKTVIPVTETKKDSIKKEVTENINEPKLKKSGYAKFFPNMDKGKKLICFFAAGCNHCRDTAKELTEMRKKDASLPPLSIIFMNEETDLIPEFFKEAGATYPYKIVDVIPFWDVLGNNRNTPGVKYLWNGNEIKYYDGIDKNKFNSVELSSYLKKTNAELNK